MKWCEPKEVCAVRTRAVTSKLERKRGLEVHRLNKTSLSGVGFQVVEE